MRRIYLISILTATFIALIILLCIILSKPKESFTVDPPPIPTSGDVLLADNKGSLTIYPLQDLITYLESSVTNLQSTVNSIQTDLTSFKKWTTTTVSDNLTHSYDHTDAKFKTLNNDLQALQAQINTKQDKNDYLTNGQRVTIQSAVKDDNPNNCETWLMNGCGKKFPVDGVKVNGALLDETGPQGTHMKDHEWYIYRKVQE